MQQITIEPGDGHHCRGCERHRQALLLRLPGVHRVLVSRAGGRARIHYNPPATSPQRLAGVMARGGPTARAGSR